MVVKAGKGTTTVDVHPTPRSPDLPAMRPDHLPPVEVPPLPQLPRQPQGPGKTSQLPDLDAIAPAPAVTVTEAAPVQRPTWPSVQAERPLKAYMAKTASSLPVPDAEGLRNFKGRLFADTPQGPVQIGLDRQTGVYRARLATEQDPSGPILMQDPDSKRWFALDNDAPTTFPLSASRLSPFRTDLDFTGAQRDSDGLYGFEGKRYAVIEGQAYQTLLDLDASTPALKVWRIVNPKDPVAGDGDNLYRASRPGETVAITATHNNSWLAIIVGLAGGMPRSAVKQDFATMLLQRYEPVKQANDNLVASTTRFNQLRDHAYTQPEGSAERAAAWVALEVHTLRHIRMQADFVKMYVDHKDWLIHLKAGGLYKKELFEQQMLRVDYLDKLMAIMDSRTRADIDTMSLESSKKKLTLLNKKLKILQDRQEVLDHIKKNFRDAEHDIAALIAGIPDAEKININKYHCHLHLMVGNMDTAQGVGMSSMMALRSMEDMKRASEPLNPIVLRYFLERFGMDKDGFRLLLASAPPEQAQHIKEIIPLLDSFEVSVEKQLTEVYRKLVSNSDLPNFDQDIDFDFLPQQPKDSPPAAPRKVFRTREQGAYKILVGEKQTAEDGSIAVMVPNAYKPNDPPQRYEKHQGEWRAVTVSGPAISKTQLISDANLSLDQVDGHLSTALTQEQQKANPTNITEFLAAKADRLDQLARQLSDTQSAQPDADVTQLAGRLKSAGERLTNESQNILLRMYKHRDVLDILRLNYLLDHSELSATRTVERKPQGKGQNKSFLDVYSIKDRASDTPLWEAHFHYDKKDSPALNFTVKGGHLKTLEQAGRGIASQRRDEQAGLPHVAIWRETFDGKTARKIFDLAT